MNGRLLLRCALLLAAATALFFSCSTKVGRLDVATEPRGTEAITGGRYQCPNPPGSDDPWLIEWPVSQKERIRSVARREIVLVKRSSCTLEVLHGCKIRGTYRLIESSAEKKREFITKTEDLWNKFPIGVANLVTEYKEGQRWSLDYVVRGKMEVPFLDLYRESLPKRCSGATHYVQRIMLGAYRLDNMRLADASFKLETLGGATGATGFGETGSIRSGGDYEYCSQREAELGDTGCGSIVQLGLEPLFETTRDAADDQSAKTTPGNKHGYLFGGKFGPILPNSVIASQGVERSIIDVEVGSFAEKRFITTYNKAVRAFFHANEAFYNEMDRYAELPEEKMSLAKTPTKDFSKPINLLSDLVMKSADSKYADRASYLLGLACYESGREREAWSAWASFVCGNRYRYESMESVGDNDDLAADKSTDPYVECDAFPRGSPFQDETWYRIGEYHYNYGRSLSALEHAKAAYEKLLANTTNPYYLMSLFRIAQIHYRLDDYHAAIRFFSKLLDELDGLPPGLKERAAVETMYIETIQAMASCFSQDDWDSDHIPDHMSIERVRDRSLLPWDRTWRKDVYLSLGQIYADQARWELAIEVLEEYVDKWTLEKHVPVTQKKIADIYRNMRKYKESTQATIKLREFGKGSEWWRANADNEQERKAAEIEADTALLNGAIYYHQTAQDLKRRGLEAEDTDILVHAMENYERAVVLYDEYIPTAPENEEKYDVQNYRADALYWSGHYERAQKAYMTVRDSPISTKHKAYSVLMISYCMEGRLGKLGGESGQRDLRKEPPPLDEKTNSPQSIALPSEIKELIEARKKALSHSENQGAAPFFDYKEAQYYYLYGHWTKAKKLFEGVYSRFCRKHTHSLLSHYALLAMARAKGNTGEIQRLEDLEKKNRCAMPKRVEKKDVGSDEEDTKAAKGAEKKKRKKTRVSGVIRLDEIILEGTTQRVTLDRFGREVTRYFDRIQRCYLDACNRDPGLEGTVRVRLTIGARGKVTSARATQNTLGKTVATCIINVVKSIQFPQPDGGSVTLEIPFNFGGQ